MLMECALLGLAISKHIGNETDFNEFHPSIGVACEDWSAGYYYNSDSRHSLWAALRKTSGNSYIEMGIITNYEDVAALPMVRVGYRLPGAEVFAGPGVDNHTGHVIAVVGMQMSIDLP